MANSVLNHSLKLGDVLYSQWGYEQTNVSFYLVVSMHGKTMVGLREVCTRKAEDCGAMAGTVMPDKNNFCNEEVLKKKVRLGYGGLATVSINSFMSASLWGGDPVHYSSYY